MNTLAKTTMKAKKSVSARAFLRSADDNSTTSTSSPSSRNSTATDTDTEEDFTSCNGSSSISSQSVLIVGAGGHTGVETLRQLADQPAENKPAIFGMTRNFKTTPQETMELYQKHSESLIEGDPTCSADIHRALLISNADTIIVCVGADRKNKTNVRTANAEATAQVLRHPPFHHVRVIVVSWTNAGMRFGMGKSRDDDAGQELAFTTDFRIRERTTIVRPTALSFGKKSQSLKILQGKEKAPRSPTNRADLAGWVVKQVIQPDHLGSVVNVASVKQ